MRQRLDLATFMSWYTSVSQSTLVGRAGVPTIFCMCCLVLLMCITSALVVLAHCCLVGLSSSRLTGFGVRAVD